MNIALLGYGVEGKSAENYFKKHYEDANFTVFEDLKPADFASQDYSSYDIIVRSPSVPPFENEKLTSVTKYFFDHCPCKIIGVTATKGKGTTCSFIKALLDAEGEDAYLVGNIGTPALDVLDKLKPTSVVVYELSSFQLWDLEKSPNISVIGVIGEDHINVHRSVHGYLAAKGNIARYQNENDYCIYYKAESSKNLADLSPAKKLEYPFEVEKDILDAVKLPGRHNRDNAIAAIAAVSSYKNISPDEYCTNFKEVIKQGLESFNGLPHRLEFVRQFHSVRYYDDNFSTSVASTRVAIDAFPDDNLVVIIGGRDKTNNRDLAELHEVLKSENIKRIVLIGESGHELARRYLDDRFRIANSLSAAMTAARLEAEFMRPAVVLMSPAAASFDMFENVYDRGAKFQELVHKLK